MFSLDFSVTVWILLAVQVILIAAGRLYGLRPYMRAASFENPAASEDDAGTTAPKVSVIVYCQNDDDVLDATLQRLFAQDYPDFEVVVVLDSNLEHADLLEERYRDVYDNLYFTFVQPGSHNLSRRKLANTIGIKAAKGEVVLTTVANISIPSDRWLSEIMAPFAGREGRDIDVVLGVSRMDLNEMTGPRKWFRQFDDVLTNGLWIGYAASGRPYRGDGYNLAFRRSVFFDHKGYSKTIYLHNGDDDLFINEIAHGGNTRVVVSDDNIVTTGWGDSANRVWTLLKERYSFTARWLPRTPFFHSGLMSALQWAVPCIAIAVALTGLPSLVPLIAASLLTFIFWGVEIYHYRSLARRLGAVRLWWTVVPFWLVRPVANFIFNHEHRANRKKNYTWQR